MHQFAAPLTKLGEEIAMCQKMFLLEFVETLPEGFVFVSVHKLVARFVNRLPSLTKCEHKWRSDIGIIEQRSTIDLDTRKRFLSSFMKGPATTMKFFFFRAAISIYAFLTGRLCVSVTGVWAIDSSTSTTA